MAEVASRARSSIRRLATISLAATIMLGAAPAFAGTTVDADAKPYLIVGGIVAAVLFIATGGSIYLIGRRMTLLGRATQDWPTASGQVISAEVVQKTGYNDGDYQYYSPEIRYSYTVSGAAYTGDTIKFGLAEVHYLNEAPALEWLARYPVGAAPQVRYDPARPEISTLELGQFSGGRLLFAGLLLLLVGLGAVWFTIWVALKPVE